MKSGVKAWLGANKRRKLPKALPPVAKDTVNQAAAILTKVTFELETQTLSLEDEPAEEANGLSRQLGLETCDNEPEMLSVDYDSAYEEDDMDLDDLDNN